MRTERLLVSFAIGAALLSTTVSSANRARIRRGESSKYMRPLASGASALKTPAGRWPNGLLPIIRDTRATAARG